MPKVYNLQTVTSMDNSDYLLMEGSNGGTKKITRQNAIQNDFSYNTHSVATISDLNTAASSGSCAVLFTAAFAIGGLTIPRYSRGLVSNQINASDCTIIIVDPSGNSYSGYRSGSTWTMQTNAVLTSTITAASGFTASENAVYKTGRVVQFIYWVSGTLSSGWNTVGTLPVGYRPIKAHDNIMIDNGSTIYAQVKINTSGEIQIYKLNTSSNNFRLAETFISST